MTISPGNDARHIVVTDPYVAPEYLLGCRKRKGDYMVELNYINMYQLGIPFKVSEEYPLKYSHTDLFDYQKLDVKRMLNQRHIYNANRMGYGKTVETICALKELGVSNALIIAPKAVLYQWAKEIEIWWPTRHVDTFVKPVASYVPGRSNIIITNYEALQNQTILQRLKTFTWDAIICDESHRLKNRKSKRWSNLMDIPALHKICLSGTPILRRVDDLWAQLFFLNWRFAGLSYWNFVSFFCTVKHGPFGQEIGALTEDPIKVALLNWLVNLACIRNEDMHIAHGKMRHVVDLKLEGNQKLLYKKARDLAFETLPETLTIQNGMGHLLRLRQITSCPQQFEETINNIKFEWIEALVNDNPDTKVLIYTVFAKTAKQLQRQLGSKSVLYIGEMKGVEQQKSKEMFIRNPEIQVLIGTIAALGTGVDGLQTVCSTEVFIDKDWSPEVNAQAEDRLNRYGQKDTVHCYYLECVGTMDRHVSRLNLSKAEDIRIALMDEEGL